MPRLPRGADAHAHGPLMPTRQLQLRRLAEDDRLPREAQAVAGRAHAVPAELLAHHEQHRHVALGDGAAGPQRLDGLDLRRHAALGVDAAAAPDLGAAALVGPEGRDRVDVRRHERARLARLADVGEDVVSRGLLALGLGLGLGVGVRAGAGAGWAGDGLGLDGEVLVLQVGGQELGDGVFVVGYGGVFD